MAKPDYWLITDTETTQDHKVADFGAILVNRKGQILTQSAVLVAEYYLNREEHPLFHLFGDENDIWSKAGLPARYERYDEMVENGTRQIASVNAINKWLARVKSEYNPYSTAYNLTFDKGKCYNSGIDLDLFAEKEFCLMLASQAKWGVTKKYRQFILDNHLFTNPTRYGNMSWQTKAETMARFVLDNPQMPDEPHTALEDARDYELPILLKLVKTTKKQKWLNPPMSTWRDRQVKNWFKPV